MSPALHYLAGQFTLLKLNITIQFQRDTELPSYKGSMLHGWFGHALKQVDEHAFFVCYGEHNNQQPKPYLICPSGDHKQHWKKGELYHFELALFGQATKLIDQVLLALKRGESLGFGSQRTPFKILSVASCTPTGLKAGILEYTLLDFLSTAQAETASIEQEMALNLLTPLRIKSQNSVCRHGIDSLDLLIKQIQRRLVQLSEFWVTDNAELFDDFYQQSPIIRQAKITNHCYFEDWERYSFKTERLTPFGGLKGQLSLLGDLAPLLSLLQIGELLHIGGKTTFGLGKYQLIR